MDELIAAARELAEQSMDAEWTWEARARVRDTIAKVEESRQ